MLARQIGRSPRLVLSQNHDDLLSRKLISLSFKRGRTPIPTGEISGGKSHAIHRRSAEIRQRSPAVLDFGRENAVPCTKMKIDL